MTTTEPRTGLATSSEVAAYRRITPGALAQERYRGDGPAFIKTGPRTVLYDWADVHAWMDARKVQPQGGAA